MTFEEKNTKKNEEFQLEDLLASGSENLLAEILQLGLQQFMELERDQLEEFQENRKSSLEDPLKKIHQPAMAE